VFAGLRHIKKIADHKSKLLYWAIVPAVLLGLALLFFQTYSLVTGKTFRDFDFNIGKLWQTEDVARVSNKANAFKIPKENAVSPFLPDQSLTLLANLKKLVIPALSAKQTILQPSATIAVKSNSTYVNELFNLSLKENISIASAVQSKQLQKYYAKIESDYLINPEMLPKKGKWYVGLSFTPTLNYRTFSYDASQVAGIAQVDAYIYTFGLTESSRNQTDKPITSYTVGLDVGRIVTDRISVYSGIHYANYGEQIMVRVADTENPNYESAHFMGNCALYERFDPQDRADNVPYTNTYSFIEIPLGVNVTVKSFEKSKVSMDVGINLQKMDHVNALVYDFETDYYYWLNRKEEIFAKFGIGSEVGVTVSQYVGERLELFINPQFKYTLNSTLKKPSPFTQNQYATGLRIGFKQQLF
jgi:hypothetical protein